LGRLTLNSRLTLSSGHGVLGLLTVVIVVFCAPYACQPHRLHQPLHGALGHLDPFAAQLVPDLARAIEAEAGSMNTPDVVSDYVVTSGPGRTLARVGEARGMFVPGGRGDPQFAADRLDTQFLVMIADERHHHLPWRSSAQASLEAVPLCLRPAQNMPTPCAGSRWHGEVPSPRVR